MKTKIQTIFNTILMATVLAIGISTITQPIAVLASGGSGSGSGGGGGGGGSQVDSIKVSKCYYDAPTGQMLIKASSSDVTAHLYAYRPDGTYAGEVQNGGGSRYGGTPVAGSPYNPGTMTIISSSGGSITVPTTPFQI